MKDAQASYTDAPGDTLLFENDRVRVWSMTLTPGQPDEPAFHQHHHDHVIVWPVSGRSQGQELGHDEWGIVQNAQPGFVLYRTVGQSGPINPHRIRNIGEASNTHYIIELLDKSPSAEPEPWVCNDRGEFAAADDTA